MCHEMVLELLAERNSDVLLYFKVEPVAWADRLKGIRGLRAFDLGYFPSETRYNE